MNGEVYELYGDRDIVQCIERLLLQWLAHIIQIDGNSPTLKVFDTETALGSRRKEKEYSSLLEKSGSEW